VRTVVCYLDALQRIEKAKTTNHENTKAIAYFIEEAQDCFNSRSTSRNDTEEFLTCFNEARNNREAFFTSSQRLTDFSKTIRAKQLQTIGKLSSEDITLALRRIEKSANLDFANMKPKTWFFEGSTFESPNWTQSGKPFQINQAIKEKWLESLPKEQTLFNKLATWLMFPKQKALYNEIQQLKQEQQNPYDPSVNDPQDENSSGESDVEEDLALLDESDTGW